MACWPADDCYPGIAVSITLSFLCNKWGWGELHPNCALARLYFACDEYAEAYTGLEFAFKLSYHCRRLHSIEVVCTSLEFSKTFLYSWFFIHCMLSEVTSHYHTWFLCFDIFSCVFCLINEDGISFRLIGRDGETIVRAVYLYELTREGSQAYVWTTKTDSTAKFERFHFCKVREPSERVRNWSFISVSHSRTIQNLPNVKFKKKCKNSRSRSPIAMKHYIYDFSECAMFGKYFLVGMCGSVVNCRRH